MMALLERACNYHGDNLVYGGSGGLELNGHPTVSGGQSIIVTTTATTSAYNSLAARLPCLPPGAPAGPIDLVGDGGGGMPRQQPSGPGASCDTYQYRLFGMTTATPACTTALHLEADVLGGQPSPPLSDCSSLCSSGAYRSPPASAAPAYPTLEDGHLINTNLCYNNSLDNVPRTLQVNQCGYDDHVPSGESYSFSLFDTCRHLDIHHCHATSSSGYSPEHCQGQQHCQDQQQEQTQHYAHLCLSNDNDAEPKVG